MSEIPKNSLEKILPQLKCHFTWNLFKEESASCYLQDRVCNQIEFLNAESKATMYNLLAYIKHLDGQNKAALEYLQKAEESIQEKNDEQTEIRSLVTWGNYAWVYYHMDQPEDAWTYVNKVKDICAKFSNPYSIECPELDCEEGWTRLQCGRNERAKMCFQKTLEEKPNNPESSTGLAIAMYRLDKKPEKNFSVNALKQAIDLNINNQYLKVLLALSLQKMNEKDEADKLVEEALEKAPYQTDVLQKAAYYYEKKGNLDKAIELFLRALESTPNNSYLYYHIMCCYKEMAIQMQNIEEPKASEYREKIEELRKLAKDHMDKVFENGLGPLGATSEFTKFLEAEKCYQKVFGKEIPEAERQPLQPHSCSLQKYQSKSEDTSTVQNGLESFHLSKTSTEKEEMKHPSQSTTESPLQQSLPNSWHLRGLNHKLEGNLQQAVECYEKKLGHLLRDAPSGIGQVFLSAYGLEGDSEEMCQDAGSSTSRERRDS
ncbi:interferon-induced protein with tetratricopeptide repeats 3 [Marmota monax]|uniref:Interferon-induced protein with tetratricopeptide repeats 3 n=1 Tax=Marmota monax TaxID=9995 RepID=A0A834QET6_MARMO|nr:interferon-induced protein with tetratricopeptide repeats 3 [Marmota monax]